MLNCQIIFIRVISASDRIEIVIMCLIYTAELRIKWQQFLWPIFFSFLFMNTALISLCLFSAVCLACLSVFVSLHPPLCVCTLTLETVFVTACWKTTRRSYRQELFRLGCCNQRLYLRQRDRNFPTCLSNLDDWFRRTSTRPKLCAFVIIGIGWST